MTNPRLIIGEGHKYFDKMKSCQRYASSNRQSEIVIQRLSDKKYQVVLNLLPNAVSIPISMSRMKALKEAGLLKPPYGYKLADIKYNKSTDQFIGKYHDKDTQYSSNTFSGLMIEMKKPLKEEVEKIELTEIN